ncbi:Methylglyoxal synthase [Desulforamulus reducens MI-1]|uniref:Methylglyoxal synthase n=1 Tax=Desulforamulus reducens (strain ATCC BAA-1160 / DSM 100696 / MI-1) TaxID=349161 RepID=A4J7I4_DESRM|nr:methylglyoxal synthase [Desulforamulus reducens]ABO51037.1 Methylglyoxal synthase [Desulforamulus reducens MI-1]
MNKNILEKQIAEYVIKHKENHYRLAFSYVKNSENALDKEFQLQLSQHDLIGTGTTGSLIKEKVGLDVTCYMSGPLGGDQQIGGKIAQGEVGLVIFLRDPLTPQPHEPDINALSRICNVHNIPIATNISTAKVLLNNLNK